MAATPKLTEIDAALWEVTAEADFLPELAELWEQENDVSRATWRAEWYELVMRLRGLEDAYRGGEMTEEQQARYQALCAKLRELLPLFRQLDLTLPSDTLDR
jgi:hypothetical protein